MKVNVGRSLVITFVSQVALYGQGLIVMPIVIKLAGETVYGSYVLILNILTTAYGLSSLGAGYNFRRRLASATTVAERRSLFEPQFSFQSMNLAIVSCALLAGGVWLQHALFGPGTHLSPWIMPVWFLSYLLCSQVADYFRYSMRFVHFNAIGTYPLLFVAMVAAYAFVMHQISLDALMLMQVASYAIVTAPLLFVMLRETGIFRFRLPWNQLGSDIATGYPLTLEFLTDLLLGFADRYIILLYLTVADVGRYQPAYQLAALALFFPKVGGIVLPAALGRYCDSGAEKTARTLVTNFLRLFLIMAIPFAAGIAMIGPSLVALLTNPGVAAASRYVGIAVALATIFNGIALVGFQIGFVLGKTKIILNANVVATAINITLNLAGLYLIRNITVPAIVSLISYVACCLYMVSHLKGLWPIVIDWRSIARVIAASAVMAILLAAVGYRPATILEIPPLHLLLHIGCGIVVYFSALAAIGGIHRSDIAQFRSIFQKEAQIAERGAATQPLRDLA